MMAKTQITLETEMQRRARQRANDLGVSLAEYFRRLVARDLARPQTAGHVDRIFDLGSSGGSDVASRKDSMIAEAFQFTRRKLDGADSSRDYEPICRHFHLVCCRGLF
jgi:hypothetical protein